MTYTTPININDLWIGDWLKDKATDLIGRYEGPGKDGKVMLRTDHGLISYPIVNLELAEEPDEDRELSFETEAPINQSMVSASIDLHIEVLNPNYANALPERIRDIQIAAARRYIQSAIDQNLKIFTIIHGKGTGVLKTEILHLLGDFPEVQFTIPKKDGGTVEVWLRG
ncbi:MAG: hypothetical protein HKN68_01905 [Saprospiraceae bacterium]|nr:hypothetical protein [Saprospiraceae bacterium]